MIKRVLSVQTGWEVNDCVSLNILSPSVWASDSRDKLDRWANDLKSTAPNSGDGVPAKSTKPSSPVSNSASQTTPSPSSVMTSANSKPTAYWSETASAMPID